MYLSLQSSSTLRKLLLKLFQTSMWSTRARKTNESMEYMYILKCNKLTKWIVTIIRKSTKYTHFSQYYKKFNSSNFQLQQCYSQITNHGSRSPQIPLHLICCVQLQFTALCSVVTLTHCIFESGDLYLGQVERSGNCGMSQRCKTDFEVDFSR